jgi:hypothetical protein
LHNLKCTCFTCAYTNPLHGTYIIEHMIFGRFRRQRGRHDLSSISADCSNWHSLPWLFPVVRQRKMKHTHHSDAQLGPSCVSIKCQHIYQLHQIVTLVRHLPIVVMLRLCNQPQWDLVERPGEDSTVQG